MIRLLLVRAGSTPFDEQLRVRGTLDMPLSPLGREEATRVASELVGCAPVALYTSRDAAAHETARILAPVLKLKVHLRDQLENLDHGLWQGTLLADIRAKHPKVFRAWQEHPESVCPPQGETIADVEKRFAAAWAKLRKRHRTGGAIALVLPEPLGSVALNHLADEPLTNLWQPDRHHAGWHDLSIE